jgi:predicted helicase
MSIAADRDPAALSLEQIEEASQPRERGILFEQYVRRLFSQTDGLSVRASAERRDHQEADLVVWNESANVELAIMGNPLFVECKWTSHPLRSEDIRSFGALLSARALEAGILITNQRLTEEAVTCVLTLRRNRLRLIVLDRDDLERMEAGESLHARIGGKLRSLLLAA